MRRLLSLDSVIEHTDLPWLPTGQEKAGAFKALDISRSLLLLRVYRGAASGTERYFPLELPVAMDSRRAVLVYADPGYDIATALGSWRHRCRRLLEAVREQGRSFEAVGVTRAERTQEGTDDPWQLGQRGHHPRPLPSPSDRCLGPTRDRAHREGIPKHGRRGGRGNGRIPGLPIPHR